MKYAYTIARRVAKNQSGFFLAPVVGLMVILLSLAMTYSALNRGNTMVLRNDQQAQTAFYIMEAGIEDAIHELANSSTWRTGFSNKAFGSGTYTVTVQDVSGNVEVSSIGRIDNSSAKATGTVVLAVTPMGPFNYAIHSNQNININSGTGLIEGDLTAINIYSNNSSIVIDGQQITPSASPVPTPDFASWQAIADTVVVGSMTFYSSTYSGIWYVDGTVQIDSGATIYGTVVATGHIEFNNSDHVSVIAGDTHVALLTQNNVLGSNSGDLYVEGVIYAQQSIQLNNQHTCEFKGSLVSPGDVHFNNSSSLHIDFDEALIGETPFAFLDNSGNSGGATIEVLAWK